MRLSEEQLEELMRGNQDLRVVGAAPSFTPYLKPADGLTEHQEQARVVKWCLQNRGADPRLALLFAVPNGGLRMTQTAILLKEEGVRPGVPDLLLPVPSKGHTGLAMEMKTQKGRVSPEQEWWLAQLREQGWHAVVCRGAEEAIRTLVWYLGQMG